MSRSIVSTPSAPAAIGPYSQAVKAGDTVYLSGQIGLDPATMTLVEGFEAQTLRVFENLKAGDPARSAEYLRQALERDRHQSAAWKLLGKALTEAGDAPAAMAAYRDGISVAEARGDLQAAKEMKVFLKRLDRASGENSA